jgi:hypothetical protein
MNSAPSLKVDRNAGEQEPSQRVIDLREGIAVAKRCVGHFAADDRRLLVEDVVGAEA